jgi:hypothetical protein
MHLVLLCHGHAPGPRADADPPHHSLFASNLSSLYQESPCSDTFCHITGTVKPISNPARQLPPTRTRKWHARLTSDCRDAVKPNRFRVRPTVAKVPYVVPCFASLLVSRIRPELPPYLGSAQGCHTLFAQVRLPFTPMSSADSPEARPDFLRAPFSVRWTVIRDTSRPTLCSPPILFSKTSTHGSCDYQSWRGCPRSNR